MDRAKKRELVASLQSELARATSLVVSHYSGMTVAESTELRRQMRSAGASFKVTKNRLTRLALANTPFAKMADLFVGPTAIAYCSDPVAAAKVAVEYAKKNPKLVIVGGGLGETVFGPEGVEALATLPSIDALRSKLIGVLLAPATKLAALMQAPGAQLARVLQAHADKGQAA